MKRVQLSRGDIALSVVAIQVFMITLCDSALEPSKKCLGTAGTEVVL